MSAVKVDALAAYAGTYQKQLIAQAVNGMDVAQDVTVLPGIKKATQFTKLTVGSILKPFNSTHQPTANALQYSGQILEVKVGKADLLIDTDDYRQIWLSELMKAGVNPNDIPEEKFTWEQVMKAFGAELNNTTAYSGVYNASGNSAIDVANGFGTILAAAITETKVTPVVTGAITLADAVEQIEAVYKSLPVVYRNMNTVAYMSFNSYDSYCENYAERFGTQPIYNQFGQLYLRHSAGKCLIKPVTWMGSSGRVIITPKENMIMGTDLLGDANKINTVPDVWTLKAGIAMAVGFQFRDLSAMRVNDIQ
ncbi:hypothetical protein [Pontibacter sp. SGAir0037]|uniref:hypothetical protein n=1 Tax=Pontibacter sp. SGAir0037 TaxID=2571030 RepID=UPI0010CD69C8|nr:hypothetical protein [Pontibacter sp. SGAir0037]QCR23086.1 hypothetical protein C1N53_12510 [Pontibacter sp. SGAir0037]